MNDYYLVKSGKSATAGEALPDVDEIKDRLELSARPLVIASDRELSVLRRGLTKPGWKRTLYLQDPPPGETKLAGAGLLCVANRWVDSEIVIPERGGHYHDFFCDGGTLLDTTPVIGDAGPAYTCPRCGKTYSGEKYDSAHRWFEHYELAAGCLALALVYQIDRESECAEKAAEILAKYAEAYPGPHTSRFDGGMIYQSLDEGCWAIMLAQAYDLIYHSKALTADKAMVEERLLRPIAESLAGLEGTGIWSAFHNSAAGVIGCALKDAGLVSNAIQAVTQQIDSELGDDGLWPESVHTFHFEMLSAYVHLCEALCRIGINLYDYETPSGKGLELMFRAPVAYAYPSFQLPAVDEGWFNSALPMSLYEIAHRRWEDPLFAWVLKTGYAFAARPVNAMQVEHRDQYTRSSLYAFLFGRDLPGRAQDPRLGSVDFPSIGLCALRGDSSAMVTFDYGRNRPGVPSQHRDQLSLSLYAGDKLLVADYGTPGWGSPIADYYVGTASHNTILVDGKSQQPVDESGLTHLKTGIYFQCSEAKTSAAYPGVVHTRRVMLIGEVVVVVDDIESDSEHTYDWLMHCEGRFANLPDSAPKAEAVSGYFSNPRSLGRLTDSSLRWESDGSGLVGWFAMDSPGEVIACEGPTETASRTAPVLNLRRKAKSARYMSILLPYTGEAPSIERLGDAFKLSSGDRTDWILVSGAPGFGEGEGEIESDAEIAAVSEVGGRVVACGLCQGSQIRLRGEHLLSGADCFERAEVRMESRNPIITFEGACGDSIKLRCHARAMRVNGHRISASCFDGVASIRLVGVLAE